MHWKNYNETKVIDGFLYKSTNDMKNYLKSAYEECGNQITLIRKRIIDNEEKQCYKDSLLQKFQISIEKQINDFYDKY